MENLKKFGGLCHKGRQPSTPGVGVTLIKESLLPSVGGGAGRGRTRTESPERVRIGCKALRHSTVE